MQGDFWHYAYNLEYWITWPPEAFDWLCWTGSDAISLAPFPVIFKSFSAWMVWPIGKSLFLHACPVFELICKECLCECVSTWVCTLCHLMGFVTMCACGYSLVLNPESAICQKDFLYASVLLSRKKISLSLHWLLSSLASPTFFEIMSNMENVWSITLLHLTLTLHWHLRLTVSFVCNCLVFKSNSWVTQQSELQAEQ